jgi:hypothetical protein
MNANPNRWPALMENSLHGIADHCKQYEVTECWEAREFDPPASRLRPVAFLNIGVATAGFKGAGWAAHSG